MGTITVNLQGNGGQSDSFDWSVLSTTQLHRDHPYITSSNSTCTSLQYTSNIYFKEKYLQQARAELCQAQEKLGLAKSDLSSKLSQVKKKIKKIQCKGFDTYFCSNDPR